jgi:ATP-binding cassette, subfamily B (MDR/TAP), member 1
MKEGIGEKLAMCIYLIMSFVVSVVFSFVYGWKLTLVVLSCAPIIIIATAFVAKMQATLSEKELKSYSSAGCVAEEVFSGIRTVVAFGGEDIECERYNARLEPAEVNGNRKGYFTGLGGGVMWFIVYCCYALAFWYGVSLILDDRYLEVKDYTPAVLIIVLFGVLVGAQNLGFTSPHLEAFATARASASSIFSIIERLPDIDSMSDGGVQPDKIDGFIEFKDVHFSYPARSDVKVLNGLNLKIVPGQTVALVGESGNGKSTCLHLIQRLYDPMHGGIAIDGVSLTDLNVSWLRANIGVVGQEPVLFATSIGENIRYGKPDASQDEIESAAKIANCHTRSCRVDRNNVSPSPELWCATPKSCCSTRPPRRWTCSRSGLFRTPSTERALVAQRW